MFREGRILGGAPKLVDVCLTPTVTDLGSGLIDQSQKRTAAAMQIAEK
jgi:hypothetical protein